MLKAFKMPKSLAECADLLYTTKEKRLKVQKEADALGDLEKALKEHLINNLPMSKATGVAGKIARVTILPKQRPQVQDWDKFYAYIKKNNAFELLQRRTADKAIEERWENKKQIPGVEAFAYKSVSINKV
jgi:hypothetical protein